MSNENKEPAPSVLVVLVPDAGPVGLQQPLAFQTDSDGSFECPHVPAGNYVLFASDDPELEYTNSEVVRPYLAVGKRIRIEPHNTRIENIGFPPAARK